MEQPEYYALRVALQTMKERCVSLQKRLVMVEDENQELRERLNNNVATSTLSSHSGGAVENIQLRMQMAELNRQKNQLNDHISMISAENRKLWSRLSQISKEQGTPNTDSTLVAESGETGSPRSSANQNLIRSKTFTQHSPNPHLRHRVVPNEASAVDMRDISLEEEALEAYQEEKCFSGGAGGGSGGVGAGEDYADASEEELAFAYLNVDENSDTTSADGEPEFNAEVKKCIEGFQEMRHEAIKQQEELNNALVALENKIASKPCPQCALKALKPETADKSLETDDSLNANNELQFYENNQLMKQYADRPPYKEPPATGSIVGSTLGKRMNIIEEKIQADAMDKVCPMCGNIYPSSVTFDAFKNHVEMHFIDDSLDIDGSVERNFEFVSHTVGDF